MQKIGSVTDDQLTALSETIARRVLVSPENVMPFADLDDLLPNLLAECTSGPSRLLSVGHLSPDVAIASDRQNLTVSELFGASPFSGSIDGVLKEATTGTELIYVANPNRVTGADLGLADIELLAKAVPSGWLIVDEYYFDYFGITGITLLQRYSNICVLRSFTAAFGVESADSGFVVASAALIRKLYARMLPQSLSMTVYRTALACLDNDFALSQRLKTLHDEALRTSTELTRLGLQNRITAADFLLLRVKDPSSVGNFLARFKAPVENLDGYPQLKNYLRYRIQSPFSNDRLIDAFNRMPPAYYQTLTIDQRVITLRRPAEQTAERQSIVIPRKVEKPALVTRKAPKVSTRKSRVRP